MSRMAFFLPLLLVGFLSGCTDRGVHNVAPVNTTTPGESQRQQTTATEASTQTGEQYNEQQPQLRYQTNPAGGSNAQQEGSTGLEPSEASR